MSIGYCSDIFCCYALRALLALPHAGLCSITKVVVTGGIWLLLLLALVALVCRNLPQIRIANGPMLSQYAALLARDFRPGVVLMSDDPRRLLLLQSWAAQKDKLKDYPFVDSGGPMQPAVLVR